MVEVQESAVVDLGEKASNDNIPYARLRLKGVDPVSTTVSNVIEAEAWLAYQREALPSQIVPEEVYTPDFELWASKVHDASILRIDGERGKWLIENFSFVFDLESKQMCLVVHAESYGFLAKGRKKISKEVDVPYSPWEVREALKGTGRELIIS